MEALTLPSDEVAQALGYLRRDGTPNPGVVRRLAREGRIPPPIDATLVVGWWRWSRPEIEAYAAGQWTPAEGRTS